ncbi:MAG: hypothetical protein AABX50_01835 [Nanoarchaeota archaeon]
MKKRRNSPKRGRVRAKPGTRGKGRYYRVIVRPKTEFSSFRVQDVGGIGGVERLAGKRKNNTWDTQAWLIPKNQAHVSSGVLIGNTAKVKNVLSKLGSKARRVKADVFRAKPRRDIPESKKPTAAMRRAQRRNIKKAQATKRRKRKEH